MAGEITTLEQAIALSKQDSPLPSLAGQALKILVAEVEHLSSQVWDLGEEIDALRSDLDEASK